jgi:hypothetical protein
MIRVVRDSFGFNSRTPSTSRVDESSRRHSTRRTSLSLSLSLSLFTQNKLASRKVTVPIDLVETGKSQKHLILSPVGVIITRGGPDTPAAAGISELEQIGVTPLRNLKKRKKFT